MPHIKQFARAHRGVTIIFAVALAAFVGLSTVAAIHTSERRSTEAVQEAPTTQVVSDDELLSGDQPVPLTDDQKAIVKKYDDHTKEMVLTLSNACWKDGLTDSTLKFQKNGQYSLIDADGKETQHSYAIMKMTQANSDNGKQYTLIFLTDTGTHIAQYNYMSGSTNTVTDDGSVVISLSSSTMFASEARAYYSHESVTQIDIKGLNDGFKKMIDNHDADLADTLSNWCSVHYPSATHANWDGVAAKDYSSSTVSFELTIYEGSDNPQKLAEISVTYSPKDGKFDILSN